jgi:hypothetical protein
MACFECRVIFPPPSSLYAPQELKLQEAAGRKNARLNSAKAQQRADDLAARRQRRLAELEQERQLSAQEPVVVGGAIILPMGLLAQWQGWPPEEQERLTQDAAARRKVELAAMAAVMAAERALGNTPHDVSSENRGYDILALMPENEQRFIEVKGRYRGAPTITVTHNEIMAALNSPRNWILAIVQVPPEAAAATTPGLLYDELAGYQVGRQCETRYLLRPFTREPNPDSLGENSTCAASGSGGRRHHPNRCLQMNAYGVKYVKCALRTIVIRRLV